MRTASRLLSIITVTYNAGEKTAATLESVIHQDQSLFDYHIVDGGSSDQTLEVIRGSAPDADVVSEPDAGVYDAINKGIARSRGRFLYFLGAGDTLRPGILARVAERIANSPPNSIVYGNVHWVSRQRLYDGIFSKSDITTHCICHQAMFIDRSVFELLGLYDRRYPISADWHFNIRCFSDPRVHVEYIDEVIADYEGGGISDTGHDARFQADLPELIGHSFGTRYALLLRLHRIGRRLYGMALRIGEILWSDRR